MIFGTVAPMKLDLLFAAACGAEDPVDNSYAAKIASKTGDFTSFSSGTDSFEGISDGLSYLNPISATSSSATVMTGTVISGTHANTATDDDVRYSLAPVNPDGLDVRITFSLGNNRAPTSVAINGYYNGSNSGANVEAYNVTKETWDRLSNSTNWMGTRNNDSNYTYALSRQHISDTGDVIIRFISTSTNTNHRLHLDRALLFHITEETATGSILTPDVFWSYPDRRLTGEEPGSEPVTLDPSTFWGHSDRTLSANGLANLSITLNALPTNYQEWLLWETLRLRNATKNKTTGVISVLGTDGTTVISTQATTDNETEDTIQTPEAS